MLGTKHSEEGGRIGLLTIPINEAGVVPLSNLIEVLNPEKHTIHLVTGNAGYLYFRKCKEVRTNGIVCRGGTTPLSKVLRNLIVHTRLALLVLAQSRLVDFWVFFMGADTMFVPLLAAKTARKPVLFVMSGSFVQTHKWTGTGLSGMISILSRACCTIADRIVLYSRSHVKEWGLENLREKIIVAPRHYVDFRHFTMKLDLRARDNKVGYVGRLSEEKGILNFIDSLAEAARSLPNLEAVIVGDGPLLETAKRSLLDRGLEERVTVSGWVPHEELPTVLNRLKLLVVPSYTEGLPNIILEAMACGTPVLATKVGAIPEIVSDRETGFLLTDNSPGTIARGIIEAMTSPELDKVSGNARRFVEFEFNRENAIRRWQKVLEDFARSRGGKRRER